MKKYTSKRTSLTITLIGFILIIFSSCTDLFHLQVEKKRYNRGYTFNTSKVDKNINSKQDAKGFRLFDTVDSEKQNTLAVLEVIDNPNKNDTDSKFKSNPLFQNRIESKPTNKFLNGVSYLKIKKNDFVDKIKQQKVKSTNASNDTPCPNNRTALIVFGIILMLLGLTIMLVPDVTAIIIGTVLTLVGLILWGVGKAKRDPYVTDREAIPLVQDDEARTPLKVPTFDFKAISSPNPKVISLALLSPKYADKFQLKSQSPFSEFIKSMEKDFEEILSEREYTFIGPFKDYDDMVYNDKSKTDLLLEVEIDISWKDNLETKPISTTTYANETWSCGQVRKVTTGSIIRYSFSGTVGVGAEISIKASEIMTRQKVWVKKISIDPEYINVQSEELYNDRTIPSNLWTKDPGFYNPTVEFLERYYQQIMKKAYAHLDPEELKLLKPQIERIREESGYNRK